MFFLSPEEGLYSMECQSVSQLVS